MRSFFNKLIFLTILFAIFLILFPIPAWAQTSDKVLSLENTLKALSPPNRPELRADLRWDPFFGSGVFSTGLHYAAFFTGKAGEQGPVLFDNREILDLPLPFSINGSLYFPEAFVTALNNTFRRFAEEDLSRFRIAAIVIDPGHGGKDSGALGSHTIRGTVLQSVEKDINLKVSKLLYSRLIAAFPDKKVILTRQDDTFLSLDERVNVANGIPIKDNEAVIYISVHANASFNKAARGYEVWYLSPDYRRDLVDQSKYADSREVIPILNDMMQEEFTTESILMAQAILRQFDEILGKVMPSRGLKEESWFVVRNARMPSVLVELGFVTNETDAQFMNDEGYLNKFSEVLYKGISEFVGLFERSGGFTALY